MEESVLIKIMGEYEMTELRDTVGLMESSDYKELQPTTCRVRH